MDEALWSEVAAGTGWRFSLEQLMVCVPSSVLRFLQDIDDLQNFACKHKVDFVAASFVQSKEDVLFIRKILDDAGGQDIKIISKIENMAGLENFDGMAPDSPFLMYSFDTCHVKHYTAQCSTAHTASPFHSSLAITSVAAHLCRYFGSNRWGHGCTWRPWCAPAIALKPLCTSHL